MPKATRTTLPTGGYEIRRVTVIGAGVMGAGIAAHCANAGLEVTLLDRPSEDTGDPSSIARGAIEKLKKSSPAALMHASFAGRITPGNTRDDLATAAKADWVIEAIIEKLEAKRDLYSKIADLRGPRTIVSSNTSTIPLGQLTAEMPIALRRHFLITHFFNPPRYMRLFERVAGTNTLPEVIVAIDTTADHRLGKTVVVAKDTPGFIANRIGTYWLHAAITHAITRGIDVETADAVLGKPASVPATGVFGLVDLVGLDLMPHVLSSLQAALPTHDAFHALGPAPALLQTMIADGYTGRKGKGGFYALAPDKSKLVRNLTTGAYTPTTRAKVAAVVAAKKAGKADGLRVLISHPTPAGRYADVVLSATLSYAANLVGEIADSIADIDAGMRLGYNWERGPFELIDSLGTAWFAEHLDKQGMPVPPLLRVAAGRPLYRVDGHRRLMLGLDGAYTPVPVADGVLRLEDIKRMGKPLLRNLSAAVWDAGDGVAVFELTSKMNTLDPLNLHLLNRARRELPRRGFKGMVIYTDQPNFSVGANLLMLDVLATLRLQPLIRLVLWYGQRSVMGIKHGDFPTIAAPQGMALGGGAELVLHSHGVVAHAETYIGLVEAGVGIIPGWGGCKELLGRAIAAKGPRGPMPPIAKTFEAIATAKVAKSAHEARDIGFLQAHDVIVMNPDRVLATAKARVLNIVQHGTPPKPHSYALPGPTGATALGLALKDFALKGLATAHDMVVGRALARVLSGGATDITAAALTEEDLLRLEREAFLTLTATAGTRARIRHLLKTGKPLRN
jgi:3-hydroxyacyl-CoA dehydrogenase